VRWLTWADTEGTDVRGTTPQIHLWYARRASTPMQPLAAGKIGDIPGEIVNWINEHSSQPAPWNGG
jgi:hypothetical protein